MNPAWRVPVSEADPDVVHAVMREAQRQEDHIELIASENYASPQVMAMQGSVLTNKYAEGYPGKRYYGGCEYVDQVEALAIERAKQLFGADYANVQPHSGSQANAAAYQALLQPGDTLLGMDLSAGGHLTHGSRVNMSGKNYRAVTYGVHLESGLLDYEAVERLAQEHQPKLLVAGFSAYAQVVDWARLRAIADSVGAYMLCDIAHVAGLVATGLYPSPVGIADVTTTTTHKTLRGPRGGLILAKANPDLEKRLNSAVFPGTQGGPLMHVIAAKAVAFKEALEPDFKIYQAGVMANAKAMVEVVQARGYKVVSGGTENHMLLLDFSGTDITGKAAEARLDEAFITTNKNSVPGEQRSPFVTSGLRIGSPALTTRGFGVEASQKVASLLCDVLDALEDNAVLERVKTEVKQLCAAHPVYREVA
jgi:glycine hydroxymethyltransferase